MWFEREMKAAQTAIERYVRGTVGTRTIIAIATIILFVPAAILFRPALEAAASRGSSLWHHRQNQAASYIETIGTEEFFVHAMEPPHRQLPPPHKPRHGIATVKQAIKYHRSECTLQIDSAILARLHDYNGKPTATIWDHTEQTWLRLGSLDVLEIVNLVKAGDEPFWDMQRLRWTPNAYHIYISNRDPQTVRDRILKTADFPMESLGWIASFHVLSPKPITEFVNHYLYLDKLCGNTESVTPKIINRPTPP
jgi:hypothetical protein